MATDAAFTNVVYFVAGLTDTGHTPPSPFDPSTTYFWRMTAVNACNSVTGDAFSFTGQGITWGFVAGSMGAFGALTLTLAMFTGGTAMPQIVMPIVFGSAVTVSAT